MDISDNTIEKPKDEKLEKIIAYYRDGENNAIKASDLLHIYNTKKLEERLKLFHCQE